MPFAHVYLPRPEVASNRDCQRPRSTRRHSGGRRSAQSCVPLARSRKRLSAAQANRALTSLNLWRDAVGSEGAKALADALRVNTVLRSLDLKGNNIGDEGALAIADALRCVDAQTLSAARRCA